MAPEFIRRSALEAFEAGVAAHHGGDLHAAASNYRRVLELEPDHASALNNLGVLLEASGSPEEAETCYRRAIAIDPSYVDAHCNLGMLAYANGHSEAALICFERALDAAPDNMVVRHRLGIVLQATGRSVEAEYHFRQALRESGAHAGLLTDLGTSLYEQGRHHEAEASYRHAIERDPALFDAHLNLGVLLYKVNRFPEADRCIRTAIALRPDDPRSYGNLGNLLYAQQRFSEAEACYRKVLERLPESVEALNNLGRVLQDAGRLSEAEQCLRRALDVDPLRAPTAFNLSLVLLAMGRYEEGWARYETRYAVSPYWGGEAREHVQPALIFPEWQGEPLNGKSMVVLPEQGLGDFVQFVRYLPILKATGLRRLTVVCPPGLRRLAESIDGVDDWIVPDDLDTLPAHDYACLLMSLPHRLRAECPEIPTNVPYLRPSDELIARWRARMPAHGIRVGLVWAGDPRPDLASAHAIDRRRSFHATLYRPLVEMPDLTFVSLQKGDAARGQISELPASLQPFDPMGHVSDFADTAAIIMNLDLVISVDTSVVHVAGAVGTPVWMLSRFDGCWRWLSDREDSPWYPTARIFRQKNPGDWVAVIESVREALRAWLLSAARNQEVIPSNQLRSSEILSP
ncbi:tetratricopeptide repeat protein [Burkholderia latens]|uniref:Putative TPR repeat protein n=1 Tax=Burkholderia latens TaxID=488446 RepID=A0A6H9SVM1_9BURK|nr:tetratricopeptide repeat protein [Burkholderia latens]KAB0644798.1 tetratricopeptide repeat protein [Burkholderia latens]VWB17263.1 putative TPR repeat protein [Burkholderia latens]